MKGKLTVKYILLGLSVILVSALSLLIGSSSVTPRELFYGLIGKEGYETARIILLSIRLPRLLSALVAGVGLSVSGVLLQCTLGNELASPNTIGVNAGAGLFAVLCLSLFPSYYFALPLGAFVGAFVTVLLILAFSGRVGRDRSALILTGVAFTTFFQAMISFFTILDPDIFASYSAFSAGSFSGVLIPDLALPSVLVAVSLVFSLMLSSRISVLSLGDSVAASLGIRVRLLRTLCLLIASLSAAAVVSFAGLLGFVGLVVPHVARRLVGNTLRHELPAAALCGMTLVTLSDLVGRTLFAPSEIPVGMIMAIIGAPSFFIILIKRRRGINA